MDIKAPRIQDASVKKWFFAELRATVWVFDDDDVAGCLAGVAVSPA